MKRIIIFLIIVALIILTIVLFDLGHYFSFSELVSKQAALHAIVEKQPYLMAAIYFLIYVIVAAASIPGAAILTLTGGALFGLYAGTLLVSFASTIGALCAFLVARFLLHDFVQLKFSDRLAFINHKVKTEGIFYLFFLRLVPIFPFFVINLLLALTPIRTWTFYWVSQAGMLPATLIYVNAGTQLAKISSPSDIVSPPLLFALTLLGLMPFITNQLMLSLKKRILYKKFNKPSSFQYNTIIVGGGAAGLVAAYTTKTLQGKALLIEQNKMGGDCLNTGCVPSKAILRSAKYVSDIKKHRQFGITRAVCEFEYKDILNRIKSIISEIEPKDSMERYSALGVDCQQGKATVISPWEVQVNGNTFTAKNLIIATGARPDIPEIVNLEQTPYFTTETIWSLSELPEKLLVIGAGPIGCELGQAFARLGCSVTIVQRGTGILPKEDRDAASLVGQSLQTDNVTLINRFHACEISRQNNEYVMTGSRDNEKITITFTHLLIATGRKARLEGLERLDLTLNSEGKIVTNTALQTNYPNIFACGDVTSPLQYTHAASHQAWYAAFNALFQPIKKINCRLDNIPRAIFTEPEIASLGITEEETRESNKDYQITTFPMDDIDRAITDNVTTGFIKVITPKNSDKISGVCIVGHHAGELIAEFALAKTNGLGLNSILKTVHIYPTQSEINRMVAGKWRRTRLTEATINLLKKYQQWRLGN